jgi:3'-phosphoadenosine 5'-phosphosulfate (PAPS) 3'-phosphatase
LWLQVFASLNSASLAYSKILLFITVFLAVTLSSSLAITKSMISPKTLGPLCLVCREACDVMAPMISLFYTAINGKTSKLKADASVFTIADGIVQHLLIDHLFAGSKFKEVVGEEDGCNVNISTRPFTVDNLTVPEEFNESIEAVLSSIQKLAIEISHSSYQDISVFIDPIDGTREFSTNLGEQCSVCIGFSSSLGKPVAGIVYRPLTVPMTWAAGALSEQFTDSHLDMAITPNSKGLLTSNGGISPFIAKLIEEMDYERVPSGGAGNKMLMLLEGKGAAYIQDRGVSRWDTSGAQAVIEANGGTLSKLTSFINRKELESYTYLKSSVNLDFEPGAACLTPYNAANKASVKKGEVVKAIEVDSVQPYSNLCGLLALGSTAMPQLDRIYDAMLKVKGEAPPAYD